MMPIGENKTSDIQDETYHHIATFTQNKNWIATRRQQLETFGVTSLAEALPASIRETIAMAGRGALEGHGIRRGLTKYETGDTPRRMRNVRKDDIDASAPIITQIYHSSILRDLLTSIIAETVLLCPYEPEQYLITRLEYEGDTQGWHIDDYALALNWVIDSCPTDLGGFLQLFPNSIPSATNSIAKIHYERSLYNYPSLPLDVYLIRTDRNLHRVYPLQAATLRSVVNMTFAVSADFHKHINHRSIELLWG